MGIAQSIDCCSVERSFDADLVNCLVCSDGKKHLGVDPKFNEHSFVVKDPEATDSVCSDTERQRLYYQLAQIKSEIAALQQAALSLPDANEVEPTSGSLQGKVVGIKSELRKMRSRANRHSLAEAEQRLKLLETRITARLNGSMAQRQMTVAELTKMPKAHLGIVP